LGVGGLGVTQTLVGVFADRPEGIPVVEVEPPSDAEVSGVTDDRLGA
jgi:hypothetical protein